MKDTFYNWCWHWISDWVLLLGIDVEPVMDFWQVSSKMHDRLSWNYVHNKYDETTLISLYWQCEKYINIRRQGIKVIYSGFMRLVILYHTWTPRWAIDWREVFRCSKWLGIWHDFASYAPTIHTAHTIHYTQLPMI